MKIIATDLITLVTPSTEDANYLATNVSDNFRTNPWKASVSAESTLTIDVAAGSNAVFLSYMNSGTVTVEVKDSVGATIYGPIGHTINLYNPNLWVDYTLQSGVAEITQTFSDPGTAVPYCGVVRAGYAYDFRDFDYGLSEGLKKFGIEKNYNNGAKYDHTSIIVRTFSGSFVVNRDSDFYYFMHRILKQYGRGPYAMLISEYLTNYDWGVFGWLDSDLGSGSHDYPNQSTISISIEEGV